MIFRWLGSLLQFPSVLWYRWLVYHSLNGLPITQPVINQLQLFPKFLLDQADKQYQRATWLTVELNYTVINKQH